MGTKRPLPSGRKDALGRDVRVSGDVAGSRASAPEPGSGRAGWQRQAPPLPEINLQSLSTQVYSFIFAGNRGDHDVSAPYQRGSVWTTEQRRNLIRSLLMGIPAGALLRATRRAYQAGEPHYRVVDGKQRLEALWAFADNELEVPADWFADGMVEPESVSADGMVTYGGLTGYGRRHFESTKLSVLEFDSGTEWIEVEPGTGTNGNAHQFNVRHRTADESLAFEAQVFELVNSAGTAMDPTVLARARQIAAGGEPSFDDANVVERTAPTPSRSAFAAGVGLRRFAMFSDEADQAVVDAFVEVVADAPPGLKVRSPHDPVPRALFERILGRSQEIAAERGVSAGEVYDTASREVLWERLVNHFAD